jgi:hypothetical protein
VQLALEVKYPFLRHIDAGEWRARVHRRPPSVQPCCVLTGPLRPVDGFPALHGGALLPRLLRVLRHAPTATADGAPAQSPKAWRAPPGRFPRSPLTGRQGRRPALPRGHRRALPQHGTRPRPSERVPDGRDGPQHKRGPSTPTAHSRQFPGCCQVSGLLTLVRLLRLSALLPHPARWRRTVARSSGAAPALHHTSGLGLPLSFHRPLRRPGVGPFNPPGHMAPRGAHAHLAKPRAAGGVRSRACARRCEHKAGRDPGATRATQRREAGPRADPAAAVDGRRLRELRDFSGELIDLAWSPLSHPDGMRGVPGSKLPDWVVRVASGSALGSVI